MYLAGTYLTMFNPSIIWISIYCTCVTVCIYGVELHPPDGYYNNLFNPDWGAAGNQLRRLTPPAYSDGAYEPSGVARPNPLVISDKIHRGASGTASTTRTAFQAFFGQLVADEIISTGKPGCPPEYTNIPIPENHMYRDKATEMTYERSGYDARTGSSPNRPRQQTNGVTSFLDAGFLYGTTKFFTDHLREYVGGRLLSSDETTRQFPARNNIRLILANPAVPRDHSLKSSSRFFRIGNAQGHMNPYLLTLQIIWFRWHNKVAEDIMNKNRSKTDDQIFYEAKKFVTAHFQKIVTEDWLPLFLSSTSAVNIPVYTGYKEYVHPGASQEFQTAMEAYLSTMIPAGVWTLGAQCQTSTTQGQGVDGVTINVNAVRLCNSYWDSQDLVAGNFDSLLQGMLYTRAEKEDSTVVPDIREYYPGPFEFSRQDQVAMLIQQGRDHGLADFNTIRSILNFTPKSSWNNFTSDAVLLAALNDVYGNTTDLLDLHTGGLLEVDPAGPGDVFTKIIIDQLTRVRDGDRFWYRRQNGLFTPAEIGDIGRITFEDILGNVTNVGQNINVFTCQIFTGTPPSCSCRSPPNVDGNNQTDYDVCTPLETFDYFSGSEISFALSFLAIALVIPGSLMVLKILIYRRKKAILAHSSQTHQKQRSLKPNTFIAEEWLGLKSEARKVKITLQKERKKINVANSRGQNLRFIDLRRTEKIQFKLSYDKNYDLVLVRIPGDVDLILRFAGLADRQGFITDLEVFLQELGIEVTRSEQAESVILSSSNNRDDRQKVLDEFFRVVCLQALKKDPTTETFDFDGELANEVINVKLTRTEFAEALALQPSSIFVRNIFLLSDKDNDGFISFREFLDMFATFARGTASEKARLMFNIYDVKRKGVLNRSDFETMIRSLLDLSDAKLADSKVTELVDVMYREAGLNNRNTMNFDDFKKVFALKEYESTFQSATIAGQGGAVASHAEDGKSGIKNRRHTLIQSYKGKKKSNDETIDRRKSKIRVKVEKKTRSDPIRLWGESIRLHEICRNIQTTNILGDSVHSSHYWNICGKSLLLC